MRMGSSYDDNLVTVGPVNDANHCPDTGSKMELKPRSLQPTFYKLRPKLTFCVIIIYIYRKWKLLVCLGAVE